MLIGYARVSTTEQNLDLQLDALRKAGCTDANIFIDKITGTKQERPGLNEALSHLRSGDTFVVWRLDRLARSLSPLLRQLTISPLSGSPSAASRRTLTPPPQPDSSSSTSSGHWRSLSATSSRSAPSPDLSQPEPEGKPEDDPNEARRRQR